MANGSAQVSDEKILCAIADHFAPAVGTADIAEQVGLSRQGVDHRLRNLKDDGLVEKYHVGRSIVWYLTPAGERYLEAVS